MHGIICLSFNKNELLDEIVINIREVDLISLSDNISNTTKEEIIVESEDEVLGYYIYVVCIRKQIFFLKISLIVYNVRQPDDSHQIKTQKTDIKILTMLTQHC